MPRHPVFMFGNDFNVMIYQIEISLYIHLLDEYLYGFFKRRKI